MKTSKFSILGMLAASLVILAATPAGAAEYALLDLGDMAEINGAVFEAYNPNTSSGTGTYDSFLRIQGNGIERGYNTDAKKPEFETKAGNWTHSLRISWVPIIPNPLGYLGLYREFKSDLNQTSSGLGPRITLDKLEIYLTHTPDILGYPFPSGSGGGEATLVWSLDAGVNNVILLNSDVSAGSGKPDLNLFVPNDIFNVAGFTNCNYNPLDTACDTYVVFYSEYGGETYSGTLYPANGGFEEWGRNIYTPATKSGVKFNDLNGNGARDGGEPGLGGWRIYVDYDDSDTWDIGEPFAVSAADGTYTVPGIAPGVHKVREEAQLGWTQSYPPIGYYEETFDWGMVLTGNDFGNWQPQPNISITKSADIDYFCLSDAPVPVIYTYLVENTGNEDLENVGVTDDTCSSPSYSSGDDGDGLLNPGEIWTYTCSTNLSGTTTNTADVVAYGVSSGAEVTDSDSALVTAYDVSVTVDPSEATICQGGDQQFCAVVTLGSGNYSYSWTKDGEPFAGDVDCITVSEAGEYCVTVIDDVTGCEDTACATLTVVPPPECSIEGPETVCEDSTGNHYCGPAGMASYAWVITSGDASIPGAADQQCVDVDAGAAGLFTIELTIVDGAGCENTCSLEVTVNPCRPGIDVEKYRDIDYFCLSDAPVPVTYTYYVTATGDENLENVALEDLDCTPVRQGDDPGNDDDILELGEVWVYTCSTDLYDTTTNTVDAVGYGAFSGTEVTDSDSATVTAYDVSVTVDPSEATICQGGQEEFCAVVTLGSGFYSYSWTKNGEPFAGDVDCITVSEAGEYCVTATDNVTGCQDSACATLTIVPPPECSIEGPETVCEDSTGNHYCGPAGMASYAWVITSGDASIPGAADQQCVDVDAGAAGLFTIELTIVDEAGCENTCSLQVTVEACGVFCTFTQGFWGNRGGKACNGVKTADLIDALLLQDGPVLVGAGGNQISLETSECIIDLLPAGGPPGPIDPAGNYYCDDVGDNLDPDLLNKQGRFDNVLIGQVVALTLNLRLYEYGCNEDGGDLAAWLLPEEFCTLGEDGCPEHFTIPAPLVGMTVQGLLDLANAALGGDTTYSIADIYKAVTAINEGFDECREVTSCPTQEVCDNGCDDDFDGLVDGDDIVDCPPIILP